MTSPPATPPVPPHQRTIGQLVADALRFYGDHFWPSLALGLGPASIVSSLLVLEANLRLVLALTAGSLIVSVCYVGAVLMVGDTRPGRRTVLRAVALGVLIFVPVWFLYDLFVLPAVLWLALVGMSVAVAVREGTDIRESLRRGFALGRADPVHAAGALATFVILAFVVATAMFFAARAGSGQAAIIVGFLTFLVVSPLLFIGSAMLYDDQVARAAAKSNAAGG